MARTNILGIHHVTAIAGDPQKNVDFYAGVLGLRLVKKTVNFDDSSTYHFYFGDEIGRPGTLLTFFPWSSQAHRGRKGTGQLTVYSFSIPHDSTGFWIDWLKEHRIDFSRPTTRFGEEIITAIDHDTFQFELISSSHDVRQGWDRIIPSQYAIQGFHGVTLSERNIGRTEEFVTSQLGFRRVGEERNRFRYEVGDGGSGTFVDILDQPETPRGSMGAGIVHHVAWRAPDNETQLLVHDRLAAISADVTPVIDRTYFHSIYFHEPGGVLFEVATESPGFLIDETKDTLGTHLKLPPHIESHREDIEALLPPIVLPTSSAIADKVSPLSGSRS